MKYTYDVKVNRDNSFSIEKWNDVPTINLTLRGSATDPLSEEVEVRNDINAYAKYSIAVPSSGYITAADGEKYVFKGWYKTGTDLLITQRYLEKVEMDLDLTAVWEWSDNKVTVNWKQ